MASPSNREAPSSRSSAGRGVVTESTEHLIARLTKERDEWREQARHSAAYYVQEVGKAGKLQRERDEWREQARHSAATAKRRLTELDAIEQYIHKHVPGGMCGDSVSSAAIDLMREFAKQRDEARAECERMRAVVARCKQALDGGAGSDGAYNECWAVVTKPKEPDR